jgi:hypothetical protein
MPGDLLNETAGSHITDPFAVVMENSNISPANAARAATASQDQPLEANTKQASEGGNKRTSPSSRPALGAAATSTQKRRQLAPTDDAAAQIGNEFDSTVDMDAHARNQLMMPQRVNLHESRLHWSPRLKELADAKSSKEKVHVTWASIIPRVVTLFTLYSLVSDVKIDMPLYNISPNATFAKHAASCLHGVNELYGGTLNSICAYPFSTIALNMSNNEVFIYTKAMQQPDYAQFIEAMSKEIDNHKSCHHWEIVRRSTIPPGHKTIQAIWSFKRKGFPDGTLNKHKARLCTHGGMQQWGVSYWETYSPVVNMLTVCLLFALCNIHGLESKSIDFVLAFPQADLNEDI